MNENPHHARRAKRKNRLDGGDIQDLRRVLWSAVQKAATLLHDEGLDPAIQLRAVHAVTQAAGSYTKVLEACEFEARLKVLEERLTKDN